MGENRGKRKEERGEEEKNRKRKEEEGEEIGKNKKMKHRGNRMRKSGKTRKKNYFFFTGPLSLAAHLCVYVVTDVCKKNGITCFGPSSKAAIIEASKVRKIRTVM